jgi:hypothetical protein
MAKLVKAIVVLAVLVAGIAVVVHYAGASKSKSGVTASDSKPKPAQTDKKPKEGIQPQEKYGFAPVGGGE